MPKMGGERDGAIGASKMSVCEAEEVPPEKEEEEVTTAREGRKEEKRSGAEDLAKNRFSAGAGPRRALKNDDDGDHGRTSPWLLGPTEEGVRSRRVFSFFPCLRSPSHVNFLFVLTCQEKVFAYLRRGEWRALSPCVCYVSFLLLFISDALLNQCNLS